MTKWTYEAFSQALGGFGLRGDPADPKERKRFKLVRAATELFAQQGYRKTSMEEVARQAGVSKGTIYLYFKTKGELLLYAVVEEKKQHLAKLHAVFDPELEAADRLRHWLRAALVVAQQMPLVSRLIQGDLELSAALEDIPEAAVASGRAMGVDLLAELLAAAAPGRWSPAELQERALVLLGLAHMAGALHEEKIRGGLSVERFAEIFADLIVDGIQPPASEPEPAKPERSMS